MAPALRARCQLTFKAGDAAATHHSWVAEPAFGARRARYSTGGARDRRRRERASVAVAEPLPGGAGRTRAHVGRPRGPRAAGRLRRRAAGGRAGPRGLAQRGRRDRRARAPVSTVRGGSSARTAGSARGSATPRHASWAAARSSGRSEPRLSEGVTPLLSADDVRSRRARFSRGARRAVGARRRPRRRADGTERADRLVGTRGADTIRGRGGNDRIEGGGGPDILNGGAGRDTVLGAGRRRPDRRSTPTARRTSAACGTGLDVVNAELEDVVADDCEIVTRQLSRDPFTGPGQHETQVEPDSASFGSTIVTVFQSGRLAGGGAEGTGWATSVDAGRTWRRGFLARVNDRVSDPVVAYDRRHAHLADRDARRRHQGVRRGRAAAREPLGRRSRVEPIRGRRRRPDRRLRQGVDRLRQLAGEHGSTASATSSTSRSTRARSAREAPLTAAVNGRRRLPLPSRRPRSAATAPSRWSVPTARCSSSTASTARSTRARTRSWPPGRSTAG